MTTADSGRFAMTSTEINARVASAAQIMTREQARDSMRRWTYNACLWNKIGRIDERDRCIARAKVMQTRAVSPDHACVRLHVLTSTCRPESWGRGEDWTQHSSRLWADEPTYMTRLKAHMSASGSWIGGPVIVNDMVVQDGHHRIVIALELGWRDVEVPLVVV